MIKPSQPIPRVNDNNPRALPILLQRLGALPRELSVVRLPDPKLKTLGERGIECIFVGYAEHSKAFRFYVIEPYDSVSINCIIESRDAIFDENRISSIHRPSLRIPNGTKDIGGSVVSEEVPEKSGIDYIDTYALVARISTIRLLIAMASIHNLIIHQMDVKTAFLNGELDEEVYMNQPYGFIMPGNENKVDLTEGFLSLRFSIKDMGDADVILGIKIKHESNGIAISQSHYIEKVLKKFNYFDCTPVSTPIDTSEKLMPNNGQAISQLEYSRVIGCLIYAMTCTRPDIAFAVGKLSSLDGFIDSDKYLEGQSMQRPPLFESDSFIYWKKRFETYVKSKDLDLWHVITNGNNQVKDNKINLLVQQYEQFVISEDESVDSAFARFNTIITSLKALNEGYSSKNYVRKFLMALHPKWRAKMIIKKDSEIVKAKGERKSLALKAKKESSDEECSTSESEDEEYAMAVRDFKKFFKRRECPKPPKDKNQRAFIGGSWSDSGEEDDEKVKDETCLVVQASNEICLGVDLEPDEWIKDRGCSKHMTVNQKLFSSYKEYNGSNVIFDSNLRGNIIGKGQICDNKCRVTFSKHDSEITKDGKVIGRGYSQNSKAYIILNKHTRKIKESLNVTFDETSPPSKTSSLVDDDLDKEEAIKVAERKS
ncbi:retrovirus-related pol polyprotein from transposon TNT 1-94 [Tanacetum coccineum]